MPQTAEQSAEQQEESADLEDFPRLPAYFAPTAHTRRSIETHHGDKTSLLVYRKARFYSSFPRYEDFGDALLPRYLRRRSFRLHRKFLHSKCFSQSW